jgi:transposase
MKKEVFKQVVAFDISSKDFNFCFSQMNIEQEIVIKQSGKCDNNHTGFEQVYSKINKNRVKDLALFFVMEATGVYYEELAYFLKDKGERVCVILPTKSKQYFKSLNIKSKTDKIDAQYLAQMGLERKLEEWQAPDSIMLELKQLVRERHALVVDQTRLMCQRHAKRFSYSPKKEILDRIEQRLTLIDGQVEEIEKQLLVLIKQNNEIYEKVKKIEKVKGLGILTIIIVVAETDGFSQIKNIRQLVSYVGLDIRLNESGRFKGKTTISKRGNSHIRSALYMPALNASQHNPTLKKYYQRIAQRQIKNKMAIIPVARKLLILVYTLWKSNEEYVVDYGSQNPKVEIG